MISIFDIEEPIGLDPALPECQHTHSPIVHIPRAHDKGISCVVWYPHDTGMFISSSFDGTIKVWDTNTLESESFHLNQRVYTIALSPISTRHCLIASATDLADIRLCDPMTGSVVHTLAGHTNSVMSVTWSPIDEYLLVSGSKDGTIRLWDVRRAGWVSCLDQYNTSFNRSTSKQHSTKYSIPSRKDGRNVPTAHQGVVTGLEFTRNGRYLVSAATDGLSCWDILSGENNMVHYEEAVATPSIRRFSISNNDHVLFYPVGEKILGYDLLHGDSISQLSGHFDSVTSTAYHPFHQELYSAGKDKNIIVWTPNVHADQEQAQKGVEEVLDVDTWSDEE